MVVRCTVTFNVIKLGKQTSHVIYLFIQSKRKKKIIHMLKIEFPLLGKINLYFVVIIELLKKENKSYVRKSFFLFLIIMIEFKSMASAHDGMFVNQTCLIGAKCKLSKICLLKFSLR